MTSPYVSQTIRNREQAALDLIREAEKYEHLASYLNAPKWINRRKALIDYATELRSDAKELQT